MLKNFIKNWSFAKPSIVISTSCYVRSMVRVSLQSGWYWFLHLRSHISLKKRKISIPFIFQNWTTWSIIAIIKSYHSHPIHVFPECRVWIWWGGMMRADAEGQVPARWKTTASKIVAISNSFLNLSIRVDSSTVNGISMRGWTLAFPLSVDSFWWMMTKAW